MAAVIGALAFWAFEPTLGNSHFLKPSALITAGSVPSVGPAVSAEPTVQQTDTAAVVALATRYEPTLVVSARDRFWPVSVLNTLRFRWGRRRTCLVIRGHCRFEPPAVSELKPSGSPEDYLQYPAAVNSVRHEFTSAARAAGIPDPVIERWRRTPTAINPFSSAQFYFYYLRKPPLGAYHGLGGKVVSLEYWFFYPLNYLPTVKTPTLTLVDPLGATIGNTDYHQGDFEHVAILLDAHTMRPRYLWMARHGDEGIRFRWHASKVQWSGDHPVVYAAFGSHAVYRGCGIQHRRRTFYAVNDYVVCIPKQTWGFDYRLTPLVDLTATSWACWPGHLGQSGRHLDRGIVNLVPYETDGPTSPLYQQENLTPNRDGTFTSPCASHR